MKLEFAKYTDITAFAKTVNPEGFSQYEKVYLCPDTLNWWLSCVLPNMNSDYEEEPGTFLIERDKIDYPNYDRCQNKYLCVNVVRNLLEHWDCSTWDSEMAYSMDEVKEIISAGFGIIEE